MGDQRTVEHKGFSILIKKFGIFVDILKNGKYISIANDLDHAIQKIDHSEWNAVEKDRLG